MARNGCYLQWCPTLPPLTLGSSMGITVAMATLSSVFRFRRRTPEVLRQAERTDLVTMRMIMPNWLMTSSRGVLD